MSKKSFSILLWLMTIAMMISVYFMDEVIPIHWNFHFEIDDYGSRYIFLGLSLLPVIIYYGFDYINRLDERIKKYESQSNDYEIIRIIITLLMLAINFIWMYMCFNPQGHMEVALSIVFCMFLLFLGNYMPRIPMNHFIGIRFSWTVNNEKVWKKTHKMGGYLYVVSGLMMLVLTILDLCGFEFIVALILIDSVAIGIYSYVMYRKEKKIC
ncbi:MAG: SdpI family protein [Erysipelotrichaceae bacterium]|nr:SdpI family protein [Erysipelotrichaceae bacterium]